jgi:1,4-dihydroxy-2-naphthoate octaprenyltransferase
MSDAIAKPRSSNPWLNAFRPKTLTASIVPVFIGTFLALSTQEGVSWLLSFYTLFSAMLVQIGTNLINDAYDFRRGADNSKRIGQVRLIQAGILTARQVWWMGIASFFLALFVGIPLVLKGGFPLLIILMLSCLFGYLYTGGPNPLAYTSGLSEVAVIIFFGPVLTGSSFYVLTGKIGTASLVSGIQIGLLATVMLTLNNLRDCAGDALVNKKTSVVRFGKTFARVEISVLIALPYLIGMYWLGEHPAAALIPFFTLPLAFKLIKGVWKEEPSPVYNVFLGLAAGLHCLYGLLLSFSFFVL